MCTGKKVVAQEPKSPEALRTMIYIGQFCLNIFLKEHIRGICKAKLTVSSRCPGDVSH